MKSCKPLAALIIAYAGSLALASLSSAAEPITFVLKFPVGRVDRQSTSVEVETSISDGTQAAPKKLSLKSVAVTTLNGVTSDATGDTIEIAYDSMKMSGTALDAEMSEDLDKAVVGSKITIHLARNGEIDKVGGVDAALAKIPAGAGHTAIKQLLNEERIKGAINGGVELLLPTKPVSIGETWESAVSHKLSAVEVKFKNQVKLVGIDERGRDRIAKLEFTCKGSVGAAAERARRLSLDHFNRAGTADFDLTLGWITSLSVEQQLKFSVGTMNGGNLVTTTVEQTIKSTQTDTMAGQDAAK